VKIALHTPVQQDYLSVYRGFNQELFLKLAPPFPKVKLLRFDGSKPNDVVAIQMNIFGFKQTWISRITQSKVTEQEAYFVDQGQQLPWPLRFWQHRHVVTKSQNGGAIISDLIEYRTASFLIDLLLYPLMLAQFGYRKPIYRRVFKK
jgi:ligand-binding SRPBCC domain-containing protein